MALRIHALSRSLGIILYIKLGHLSGLSGQNLQYWYASDTGVGRRTQVAGTGNGAAGQSEFRVTLEVPRTRGSARFSRILGFAEADRAIAGMNHYRLAPAIHLPVKLRIAERSLNRNRYPQADVTVVGTGVDVGLQVSGEHDIDAAVTGAYAPTGVYL